MTRSVFIKQDPPQKEVSSGFIVPDSVLLTERPNTGIIVSVGPGTADEPMNYKVGNHVMYNPHAGTNVSHDGQELIMIVDTDVYCEIK